MYRDTKVVFPGSKQQHGCYYGPAYDIGPAIYAKIVKENGEYSYHSNFRGLTAHKIADLVQSRLQKEFNRRIVINLGPKAKVWDFPDHQDTKTPHHGMYDNDDGVGVKPVPDCDDKGYQNFDNYLNAEVPLPLGEAQLTAKIKRCKLDDRGNQMVRPHSN